MALVSLQQIAPSLAIITTRIKMDSKEDRVGPVGDSSYTVRQGSVLLSPAETEALLNLVARATCQNNDMSGTATDGSDLAILAQRIFQSRRNRQRHFSDELFGEPAWDMLLAAYWLPTTGVELTVLGLCGEASASKTTAWRALERLIELKFIETQGGKDRRSTKVMLTTEGRDRIEGFLRDIATSEDALSEYAYFNPDRLRRTSAMRTG